MRAGRLRNRVTFQSQSTTRDAAGERLDSWADVVTVWGRLVPISASQIIEGGANRTELTHRIEIRYHPGITAANMRAVIGTRVFEVDGVIDVDDRTRELHLLCVESPSAATA